MKRLLIKQDDQQFNKIEGEFNAYMPLLEKVKELYEQLNIGQFSEAIFNDIKDNVFPNVAERYKAELNNQLDAAGVTFPALRKQQFDGSLQPLHDFTSGVKELHGLSRTLYQLRYAKYSDQEGEFLPFSPEGKEEILDTHCRSYTETEEEYKLYTAAYDFLNAYKKMEDTIREIGGERMFFSTVFGTEGFLNLENILSKKEREVTVDKGIVGLFRAIEAQRLSAQKQSEKEAAKKKAKEEEESKKVYFDISTPEGSSQWEEYSRQKEHEKQLERQKLGHRY